MTNRKKINLKKVLVIIIAALVLFSATSMAATKIIYDSIFVRYDTAAEIPTRYASLISQRETKTYMSGENKLTAHLYRAQGENKKDALIIFAPGFNSTADNYVCQIADLLERGWSVFAFNPTGCGESEGDSTIGFPQEVLDLEATIKYVEICNNFGYNSIMLLGHSRGGYAVCAMLERGYDIKAAVSISGVNSSMEAVIGSAENKVGAIAYGNYGFLWLYQSLIFGSDTVNIAADEVLSDTSVPVLILHGRDDTEIPKDKYSIYSYKDEIQNQNTDFELISGGHTDLLFAENGGASESAMSKIDEFLTLSLE